jgi:hypothetical protein
MRFRKRAVEPYVIELDEQEKHAYQRLRIAATPRPPKGNGGTT